jgi:hypothetical protein
MSDEERFYAPVFGQERVHIHQEVFDDAEATHGFNSNPQAQVF